MKSSSFRQPCEACEPRFKHPVLLDPGVVFTRMMCLQPGDKVPMEVYIGDYDCATIPPWTVRERTDQSSIIAFLLFDANAAPTQSTLFDPALSLAIQVFTCPAKTLATPLFLYGPGGYGPKVAVLHDLLHEATLCNKRIRPLTGSEATR